jgi:hypothetical protein
MSKILSVAVLLLGLPLLAGCAGWPFQETKTDLTNSGQLAVNSGLPVIKVQIETSTGRRELEMEVASTDAQRKVGLMNRRELAEGRGMLFIFESQGYLNFWMKNTLIALDMVFVDSEGTVKHVVHQAQPCTAFRDADCPKYSSQYPARYVLEIGAGQAEKLGIETGDRVSW